MENSNTWRRRSQCLRRASFDKLRLDSYFRAIETGPVALGAHLTFSQLRKRENIGGTSGRGSDREVAFTKRERAVRSWRTSPSMAIPSPMASSGASVLCGGTKIILLPFKLPI